MIKTEAHEELRRGVREVCERFPDEYWRGLDAERRYPEEFVRAMTEAGYLGALIPEEYGGMGLEAVMNSMRNGLGMRKTGDRRKPTQPDNPHSNAVFARVHNTL